MEREVMNMDLEDETSVICESEHWVMPRCRTHSVSISVSTGSLRKQNLHTFHSVGHVLQAEVVEIDPGHLAERKGASLAPRYDARFGLGLTLPNQPKLRWFVYFSLDS